MLATLHVWIAASVAASVGVEAQRFAVAAPSARAVEAQSAEDNEEAKTTNSKGKCYQSPVSSQKTSTVLQGGPWGLRAHRAVLARQQDQALPARQHHQEVRLHRRRGEDEIPERDAWPRYLSGVMPCLLSKPNMVAVQCLLIC